TKLWNAARFTQMNECHRVAGFDPASAQHIVNRWIRGEAAKTVRAVTRALDGCAFDDAAGALYRFVWNVFCDWYLELAKPILSGPDGVIKDETRAMTAWARDEILKPLHPFTPFVTAELCHVTAENGPRRESLLALAAWPTHAALE